MVVSRAWSPGCRWAGNEQGLILTETNWSTLDTAGFKRGEGAPHVDTLNKGNEYGKVWLPAECDVSIRPGWFYHAEEDSKVTVLDTAHPFFNFPNKIAEADFDNWVEERGSKWMTTWDERFQPLLECHDRQQAPQKGGLMFAPYGKGAFTYAAYAFYRQLPAGVPGAYRLFANIVSWRKQTR